MKMPQLFSIRARVTWWLGLELSWTICSKRLLISFNDILPPNEWLRGATETWLSVSGRSLCDEGGPDLSVWWTIYPCSGNNWQRWQRWGYESRITWQKVPLPHGLWVNMVIGQSTILFYEVAVLTTYKCLHLVLLNLKLWFL